MRCAALVRSTRRRRGAATVEMAAIAPVLVMLILGSIEFGRAMMVSNLLTTASREGARVASLPGKDNADVTATVNDRLNSSSIPSAKSTITVKVNGDGTKDASTAMSGDKVSVEVTVKFGDVSWLPTPWFLSKTSQMHGGAVMRRE
jgi:Flp pilus assembly protein TadG